MPAMIAIVFFWLLPLGPKASAIFLATNAAETTLSVISAHAKPWAHFALRAGFLPGSISYIMYSVPITPFQNCGIGTDPGPPAMIWTAGLRPSLTMSGPLMAWTMCVGRMRPVDTNGTHSL